MTGRLFFSLRFWLEILSKVKILWILGLGYFWIQINLTKSSWNPSYITILFKGFKISGIDCVFQHFLNRKIATNRWTAIFILSMFPPVIITRMATHHWVKKSDETIYTHTHTHTLTKRKRKNPNFKNVVLW